MISLLASLLISAEAATIPDINALTGFDTVACEGEVAVGGIGESAAVPEEGLAHRVIHAGHDGAKQGQVVDAALANGEFAAAGSLLVPLGQRRGKGDFSGNVASIGG